MIAGDHSLNAKYMIRRNILCCRRTLHATYCCTASTKDQYYQGRYKCV